MEAHGQQNCASTPLVSLMGVPRNKSSSTMSGRMDLPSLMEQLALQLLAHNKSCQVCVAVCSNMFKLASKQHTPRVHLPCCTTKAVTKALIQKRKAILGEIDFTGMTYIYIYNSSSSRICFYGHPGPQQPPPNIHRYT